MKTNLQNSKHQIPNTQKGITLVALIITIIVLLILAMVSVSLVMNGGIINKSKAAVDKYSEEEIGEQLKLAYSEWQMGQYTGETQTASSFIQSKLNSIYGAGTVTSVEESNGTFTVSFANGKQYTYNVATGVAAKVKTVDEYPEATPGTATTENSKYTSGTLTAVIPAGYTVSNVAAEQSIENGLVIKKGNNEWVWIPVANVTDLYTTNSTNTEWILCGTSGENKVVSSYASKSEILSGKTRTTPGTTSDPYFREPDTVVGNGTEYDAVEANYTAAGFTSFTNMATSLRDDYKNMIDSIRKYGGFYVGRYELAGSVTVPVEQKNQTVLNNKDWYDLYKACKGFEDSYVYSRMIWGCQWDQICLFINQHGDKVSLTDSNSYGNFTIYDQNWNKIRGGKKENTGSSETYKTNNIYDLAGNYYEWTQEVGNIKYRISYGSFYGYNGSQFPVTSRYSSTPDDSSNDGNMSSRSVLYIK